MTNSNLNPVWAILFRVLQTALESAPTLLCGLVIAGLMRGLIGSEVVRRWFTDDPRIGPLRAVLIGWLLPVCSFGALPIAWELRRAGVRRATVLTFLLAAPLADPISLLSAFQRMEGEGTRELGALLFLFVAAFAVVAGSGVLLGRLLPESSVTPDATFLPASELGRLGVAGLTAARRLTGPFLIFVMIGLAGSGLLALVPGGALKRAAADHTVNAPFHMALVALPFQVSPQQGLALACDMLIAGTPWGAVFVFLVLGIGVNLGTWAWIAWQLGSRALFGTTLLTTGATLALGFAMPFSLPQRVPDQEPSLHLLEIESSGGAKTAWNRAIRSTVTDDAGEPQWMVIGASGVLGVLAVAGVICRALGEKGTIPYWLPSATEPPTAPASHGWNKSLSGPQFALAGIVLLLIVVLPGLYIYYPPPDELLEHMDGVQLDIGLMLKADPIPRSDVALAAIQWQRLRKKLTIADFLRSGRFDAGLRTSSSRLREALDRLRAAVREGNSAEELAALLGEARQAASGCDDALRRRRQ